MTPQTDEHGRIDLQSVEELSPNDLHDWIWARLHDEDTAVPGDPRMNVGQYHLVGQIYDDLLPETQAEIRRILKRFLRQLEDEHPDWTGRPAHDLLLLVKDLDGDELAAPIKRMARDEQFLAEDEPDSDLHARLLQALVFLGEKVTPEFWERQLELEATRYGVNAFAGMRLHSLEQALGDVLPRLDLEDDDLRTKLKTEIRGLLASNRYSRDDLEAIIGEMVEQGHLSSDAQAVIREALPELELKDPERASTEVEAEHPSRAGRTRTGTFRPPQSTASDPASESLRSGSKQYQQESSASLSEATKPIFITAALPPDQITQTRKVWSKLLHAAVIPLLVGIAVFWLEGEFSAELFQRAWPVMALLAAAYGGGWVLSSKFKRFPFLDQFEMALLSVSVTLVPVGGVFAALPGSPINTLALLATVGSIGWYLADKFLHRYRKSHLLVLPGGMSDRLLAAPGITREEPHEMRSQGLDGIVVDPRAFPTGHVEVLSDYSIEGVPTYHPGYIYELLTARVPLESGSRTRVEGRTPRYYSYVKRAIELLLIGTSVPITGPIMALAALAIRLESRGPILIWQERIGQGGEPFQMAKFRCTYVDKEGGDKAASKSDDRVTTVGRFIRQVSIDELPQFWNVLKGEMSLIGPRAVRVGTAQSMLVGFKVEGIPLYAGRHAVPPGITGWTQVFQGLAVSEETTRLRFEHDLYYVKHRSITLDLLIVYLTFKTVLTGIEDPQTQPDFYQEHGVDPQSSSEAGGTLKETQAHEGSQGEGRK